MYPLEFIKELLKKISKKNNWSIILDNARIHYYKKFKEYINTVKNVKIIYYVLYSPETNPIERIFKNIKKYIKDTSINNNNGLNKINRSLNTIKKGNINSYFIECVSFQ
jgi:endonuclease IV